jgi:hypothetical protein
MSYNSYGDTEEFLYNAEWAGIQSVYSGFIVGFVIHNILQHFRNFNCLLIDLVL